MCGRFTLHSPQAEILQAFDVASDNVELVPRYNITPSQDIPVVRAGDDGRELAMARWGLVPGWSKDARPKYSTINARVESVAEKPTYRAAFRHKRCLIPADGFYEWQKRGDRKIPHYIRMQDESVFAFAGLWEHWEGEQEVFDSCAIITLPASGIMTPIHTRMPAIIATADYDAWLDTDVTDKADIMPKLASTMSGQLQAYAVGSYVNSPKHTDARCIEPL
ncbi:MAG: SOS response-associated peptidase [Gammaproteobacteria bacterium]